MTKSSIFGNLILSLYGCRSGNGKRKVLGEYGNSRQKLRIYIISHNLRKKVGEVCWSV